MLDAMTALRPQHRSAAALARRSAASLCLAAAAASHPAVAADPWAFAPAPPSTTTRALRALARDRRDRAATRGVAREDLQDARLRQCEAEGRRWEDCFWYGTGGDRGGDGARAARPRRGPATW